jgi:ABC-type multidrug transport system fused ATPase/permease subunit
VSFLLYAITVAAAVGALASLFGSYQEAVGAATAVFELLATAPTVAEPPVPFPLAHPVRGDVQARPREPSATRTSLPDVLSEVSLHIAPARRWRSWGRAAPARPPWRRSCRASGT